MIIKLFKYENTIKIMDISMFLIQRTFTIHKKYYKTHTSGNYRGQPCWNQLMSYI